MFSRTLAAAVCAATLLSVAASAFEVGGIVRAVDPENRILRVFANGQLRVVRVADDARFLDREGKSLADGLRSKELKDGTEVTLTVEPERGQPVIRAVRLGRPGSPPGGAAPPPFDSSKLKPLSELGRTEYQGFTGGLYPEGRNERPAAHEAAGVALAARVRPLDADGKPAPDGRIVLLTLGMSNTAQATQGFKRAADPDPAKNPRVVIVNGAQGGMTAARTQNPDDGASGTQYWAYVDQQLRNAGVTRGQVQAVWIKQADAGPSQGFPGYAKTLQAELARIVQVLPGRFPNVKLAYLSSRTYGGYATTRLNPEPYAYESAFSVKWLIEQQVKGDPALSFDPAKGPRPGGTRAPWLSWGPYLWANGSAKRADGFAYEQADFTSNDGTHESPSGQRKVGELLLKFFKTDSTARVWFLAK